MSLSPEQQQSVAAWARAGVSLSDIQKRIGAEFGVTLTYRDVRFLVDDLQVDLPPPPPKPAEPAAKAPVPAAASKAAPEASKPKEKGGLFGFGRKKEEPPVVAEDPEPLPGVKVEVDRVVKPGTMVSGSVVFSDGQKAEWYMDQMGRLGLGGVGPGYRPPAEDIQEFQVQLQQELMRLGYA